MINRLLTQDKQAKTISTPPLESGDRLTRHEFERRYTAIPDIKKAELIEGVVYVASPLRFTNHAEPHGLIITWLGIYQASTPKVKMGIEPTVRLDLDNEPQPDGVLFIDSTVGGKVQLSDDDYLEGAPELVVEVLSSGAEQERRDKEAKLKLYSLRGVQEYWIADWRLEQMEIYRRENAALVLVATLTRNDELNSPLLPDFACSVRQFF